MKYIQTDEETSRRIRFRRNDPLKPTLRRYLRDMYRSTDPLANFYINLSENLILTSTDIVPRSFDAILERHNNVWVLKCDCDPPTCVCPILRKSCIVRLKQEASNLYRLIQNSPMGLWAE